MFIGLAGVVINFIANKYLQYIINSFFLHRKNIIALFLISKKISSNIPKLLVVILIYLVIPTIKTSHVSFSDSVVNGIELIVSVYLIFLLTITLNHIIDVVEAYSQRVEYLKHKPIKSYFQIVKIIIWFITFIIAVSIIFNKSPMVFLTGLGALSAVTMLVFKDTILGFVASIQVSAYDSVRVGDWITIAEKNVDGDVIDISVNTVKIRNFNKTIVTIPTYELMTTSVQNWRGMTEAGGRQIKRAILIDIDSIHFCDKELLAQLSKLALLREYIQCTQDEIHNYNINSKIDKSLPANGRELTNIGLFRIYIENYLRNNDKIRKDMTFLVRQLKVSEVGIPIEIYVFTNDTNWINYERIQSDIFDHLLATLPYFQLKAFQLKGVIATP